MPLDVRKCIADTWQRDEPMSRGLNCESRPSQAKMPDASLCSSWVSDATSDGDTGLHSMRINSVTRAVGDEIP